MLLHQCWFQLHGQWVSFIGRLFSVGQPTFPLLSYCVMWHFRLYRVILVMQPCSIFSVVSLSAIWSKPRLNLGVGFKCHVWNISIQIRSVQTKRMTALVWPSLLSVNILFQSVFFRAARKSPVYLIQSRAARFSVAAFLPFSKQHDKENEYR